jgi:hypothetical protein
MLDMFAAIRERCARIMEGGVIRDDVTRRVAFQTMAATGVSVSETLENPSRRQKSP